MEDEGAGLGAGQDFHAVAGLEAGTIKPFSSKADFGDDLTAPGIAGSFNF